MWSGVKILSLLASFVAVTSAATSCSEIYASGISSSLPCVEVPSCPFFSSITINTLSDGTKSSQSTSSLQLCHDSSYFHITHTAFAQKFFPSSSYKSCNDAIYNLDVAEAFIGPHIDSDDGDHCYSEIDVNPTNEIYESGIYNPNLNHTGASNKELTCTTSGVLHATVASKAAQSWTATLNIPWKVLNCPAGCPDSRYCSDSSTPADVYRVNFYRVNELSAVTKCSSSVCEYMAWSPTLSSPPAFHEPKQFGYLVVV